MADQYWYTESDQDFGNIDNWWTSADHDVQSDDLPANGDSIYFIGAIAPATSAGSLDVVVFDTTGLNQDFSNGDCDTSGVTTASLAMGHTTHVQQFAGAAIDAVLTGASELVSGSTAANLQLFDDSTSVANVSTHLVARDDSALLGGTIAGLAIFYDDSSATDTHFSDEVTVYGGAEFDTCTFDENITLYHTSGFTSCTFSTIQVKLVNDAADFIIHVAASGTWTVLNAGTATGNYSIMRISL